MFILSQDKTRIFNTSGHIEGIGYKEENFKEGKKEEIRHTIQVFGGCAEEIAEYKCKEDCLLVLYAIFNAIEQGGKTAELPTQEEMKEQREALKQYLESGKKASLIQRTSDARHMHRINGPEQRCSTSQVITRSRTHWQERSHSDSASHHIHLHRRLTTSCPMTRIC